MVGQEKAEMDGKGIEKGVDMGFSSAKSVRL